MIDLNYLPKDELETMFEAASVVLETMRVLQNTQSNVVKEILNSADNFYEWAHIPTEDVYDFNTYSQYYYHAHAKSEDGNGVHDDEHGHFHTFIRGRGFPEGVSPAPLPDFDPTADISDINTHLIAIGMDEAGHPMRLFTTNRWVSADTWCVADDVLKVLPTYNVDHAQPSWPVNLWVTNMLRLFRPQITDLITQRDQNVEDWASKHPDRNVYEDRELEVTSLLDIDLSAQIDAVEATLRA